MGTNTTAKIPILIKLYLFEFLEWNVEPNSTRLRSTQSWVSMSLNLREESRETSSFNKPETTFLSHSSYVLQEEHIFLSEQNIETDGNPCLGLASANSYKTDKQG